MLEGIVIFSFFVGGVFLLFAACAFYAEWRERQEDGEYWDGWND